MGSSDEDFEKPSDEDSQGNVLTMHHMDIGEVDNTNQTPSKQDTNPTSEEQEQETPPSPKRQDRRLRKQDDETEKIKKLLAVFTANTQKQLNEQAEKHPMEIAAMKQKNMETQTS
jgi:hypothetical protein